jgi:hypothetical protein
MILTENHLILPEDLFGLNQPKQLDMNCWEKRWSPPILIPGRCTRVEEGEGPLARRRQQR